MEKHNYIGKTKEEAIQLAKEELQEVEENLFIKELETTKGGLFKSKKVEIEVVEKREVIKDIKDFLIKLLNLMGYTANIEVKNKEESIQKFSNESNNKKSLMNNFLQQNQHYPRPRNFDSDRFRFSSNTTHPNRPRKSTP